MSEPINFVVTNVGKAALYQAQQIGIKLSLNKVGLGAGQYVAAADRVQMAAKFAENGISAGAIETESFALRFTMIMNHTVEKNVSELGLYTSTGVLFAVASKLNGAYFRLYPGIDYVATLGLLLETTTNLALVDFILDGRGGVATQLLQEHLTAADPHPQYKEYTRLAMTEHLADPDPHPQYALKTFVGTQMDKINQTIGGLVDIASLLFPPVLSVGTAVGADTITPRAKGGNYSLIDRSIVHLFCPEASHEGWSSVRESNLIKSNVFNRSGANRIGYAGRVSWAMIDTQKILINKGFVENDTQLTNEIKSGVFEVGEKLTIFRENGEVLDYTDSNVIIVISPEGVHEGWTVARTKDQISIDVFNRSGTNRIGYSGRVNWALFKANNNPDFTGVYPRQLIAGFSNSADFTIPVPANIDFTDTNFLPFITPEAGHEGWSIARTAEGFKVNVFNRSGTNSIGYSGRVNWVVFAVKKPINRKIYFKGQHSITVPAGKSAMIDLFAPGGGGGGSIYSGGNSSANGIAGGNTTLTYKEAILTAGGGKQGTGGVWGNGSSYHNGSPGEGGINTITGIASEFRVLSDVKGNPGINGSRYARQQGGEPTSLSSGLEKDNHGGMGAWGIGDEQWSYGGGAGSGGYIQVEFKNNSGGDAVLNLDIGAAGTGWKSGGRAGDDGGEGFVIVGMDV